LPVFFKSLDLDQKEKVKENGFGKIKKIVGGGNLIRLAKQAKVSAIKVGAILEPPLQYVSTIRLFTTYYLLMTRMTWSLATLAPGSK
jgi:hypothetical protein